MTERSSGILLHISSLPGHEGIGTLGSEAYRFVDFLKRNGQKNWQILPLGPVGFGNSPYLCYSAFAGNPLFIDLTTLSEEKLLEGGDFRHHPGFPSGHVDFESIKSWKYPLLQKAFEHFRSGKVPALENDYHHFLKEHQWWLNDYAMFIALKKYFKDISWSEWEDDVKFRKKRAIHKFEQLLEEAIDFRKFMQFLFFRQWFQLKDYAHSQGVRFIGDLPLYVSGDSSDIWSNTDIFQLDKNLNPEKVGGVPPDYFSKTGQLWGNPLYDWQRLEERGFDWWIARLHFNIHLFDMVRIDHFRGLEAYWAVPAGEKTAVNGEWLPARGFELLKRFRKQTGSPLLIAEDLGKITPEVEKLRDHFGLPGMKVLQFAYSSDETNIHLPHNYTPPFIAYTGTHDNDTTLGWLHSRKKKERKQIRRYLGNPGKKALRKSIESIWSSCARTAIIPMQDVLGLDSMARLNTPGTSTGNWEWRFRWKQLKPKQEKFLESVTSKYNR